ncbi:MAG: phosphorylated adapter RNA export RNA-binding domain-containing protein [Chloroflexota bacterium]|nr:phosphorylated adapter RNA export RNA-binding domain-containing protein [Chloroflexota bacterium]
MTRVAAPTAVAGAALVRELADRLGETAAGPRHQLGRVVAVLGEARARALLAEALAIEGRGGLLLPDGSRRRTPGGVFFHLARTRARPEEVDRIFPPRSRQQQRQGTARDAGVSRVPAGPAFTWDDYPARSATTSGVLPTFDDPLCSRSPMGEPLLGPRRRSCLGRRRRARSYPQRREKWGQGDHRKAARANIVDTGVVNLRRRRRASGPEDRLTAAVALLRPQQASP